VRFTQTSVRFTQASVRFTHVSSCVKNKMKYLFSHLLNFGKVTQATLASYTNSSTTHKTRESVRSLPVLLTLSPTTTLHTKTKVWYVRINKRLLELRQRRRLVQATRGVCPLPTAVGPRGGKVPDVVVSNAASTSVAAGPTLPAR
jgi:hypothetical protein